MYYGAERLRDVNFLRQQDIVLTTYPTLTNDYRRVRSTYVIKYISLYSVVLETGPKGPCGPISLILKGPKIGVPIKLFELICISVNTEKTKKLRL